MQRRDGARQFREDAVEYQIGQILCDALFVVPTFLKRAAMERARVSGGAKECVSPEEEHEHLQPVAAVGCAGREETVVVSGQV